MNLSPSATRQPWISQRWLGPVAFILVLVALLIPRLGSLGSFVTADEPTWGNRSASFYYALSRGDYADTYQTGHPGVTTMWAGAAAYFLKFPQYQRVGQASIGDTKLFQLFQKHGPNPMDVLSTARLFVVGAIVIALLIAFLFTRRLLGTAIALLGFLFIAFDPFQVAHARVLHTNGMLGSFMFLSVMAFLDYLRTRKPAGLVVSGAAAGLSFITITPGFFLVPIIGLLAFYGLWDGEGHHLNLSWQTLAKKVILPVLLWGTISLLVIYLVWPAMWGHPVETMSKIFHYALNASEGEIGGAHLMAAYADPGEPGSSYPYFYPLTYLWRTTPVVLIGLVLGSIALFAHRAALFSAQTRWTLLALLGYVVLYGLFMTLGQKKFDRYFLPVYPALELVAAAGWLAAARWLQAKSRSSRLAALQRVPWAAILLVGLVAFQAFGTLRTYPYYFTYFNPLMGGLPHAPQVMSVGWGEGLNDAALYLKEIPGIGKKKILSWYPLAFTWYSLDLGLEAQLVEFTPDTTLSDYLSNDYAVIYINQLQRNLPSELLDYLAQQPPEHSIYIDGVEFARIYRLHPETSRIP